MDGRCPTILSHTVPADSARCVWLLATAAGNLSSHIAISCNLPVFGWTLPVPNVACCYHVLAAEEETHRV